MITLKNVNKYFFRHKRNEIHVINDTSLELGDTGLVAMLGPSGCGKTTLLNAIGGLDKINSGRIYINGKKMPRRGHARKDKMRVLNIGYIFQNYNLLDNLSVYDNVALSLKMIGIKNKAEIKKRVEYILDAVGMYRYRNKPAGMLSGGQRQRVGIARAIVKNPDVIIADEPTGNLDSKNTLEIMNIIKSISKDKLVILVTHEKELAEFYASRIIRLEDGKVLSDEDNSHENELDYRIDNKIYLKDFERSKKLSLNDKEINFYYDKDEKVSLDIVIKNGNIYIKSNEGKKIEVVDDSSAIEFVDEHYKKIKKDDFEKSKFDLAKLDNSHIRLHYASIYNLFSMFRAGFRKVASYTLMKKILLVGFLVSSMFIVFSVSSIFGSINIKDSDFVTTHTEYIEIENNQNKLEDFLAIENTPGVSYVIPGSSEITFRIKNDKLFQLRDAEVSISGSLASENLLHDGDVFCGMLPETPKDIVVDRMVIDNALKTIGNLKMLNLQRAEDFVGFDVKIGEEQMRISGISDTGVPCIYSKNESFFNIISSSGSGNGEIVYDTVGSSSNVKNYELYKDKITLKKGRLPENDYEVMVNISNEEAMPLNKTIDMKVNDKKLTVVGYYHSRTGISDYIVSANTFKIATILGNSNMMIVAEDKDAMVEKLKIDGFNARDKYEYARAEYIDSVKDSILQSLIIASILLAISFVEIYLMIRASFLSRIKEVGIYRAIGVKKLDIYKMFLGEILIITTLAGLPGAILMASILRELTKITFFGGKFVMDAKVIIVSLILIYGLNMIIGLLPIRHTIKKTPAEILSRNDVD